MAIDYSAITGLAADHSAVTGVVAIGVALAAVAVATKGVRLLLDMFNDGGEEYSEDGFDPDSDYLDAQYERQQELASIPVTQEQIDERYDDTPF